MKKYILLAVLSLFSAKNTICQVVCIYCYDQNSSLSPSANNIILNGSFENTNCIADSTNLYTFCPNATLYSCTIANWTGSGGGSNTYSGILDSVESVIPDGNYVVYMGNYFCDACINGDTGCIINNLCTAAGVPAGYPVSNDILGFGIYGVSLSQTVNGLSPGNAYALDFWAGGEYNRGGQIFTRRGLFGVDVGFGDTLLRCNPTAPVSGIGTRYIVEFIATSPSQIIKFTNWGHICDSCTELILDDVRLYTLSELSSTVPHCSLGIDDWALQNSVTFYPNPVTNELNFKISSNESAEIILYDIASRKLYQQIFTNSVSINTEQFAKGIYLYEVRFGNSIYKKGKFVKD